MASRSRVKLPVRLRVLLTTGRVTVGDEAGLPIDEHLPMLKKPYRRADLSKKLEEVLSLIGCRWTAISPLSPQWVSGPGNT
jgi:hypothetical protein